MSTENTGRTKAQAAGNRENLQARYKPLGLRAVVAAATQRKPQHTKTESEHKQRDIPAILKPFHD